MARTPVGTSEQSKSATALAAGVAAGLSAVPTNREFRDAWLKSKGLAVRSNALTRALARSDAGVKAWRLVDETGVGLGLEKAFVVFPGNGSRRKALAGQIALSGFARQIIVTRSRRDIVCVLVYRKQEKEQVFRWVEDLETPFLWDDVIAEDREVEADTWLELARQFAHEELLGEGA